MKMTSTNIVTSSTHGCFGGVMSFHRHDSVQVRSVMRFSVYLPPQAQQAPVPVLYYLAGLTCGEDTFMMKGGAQRLAAELGIALVAPDTSPRESRLNGDDESWDFGLGAGFYVDAIQEPWAGHYRMYSYVTEELPRIVSQYFPVRTDAQSIFGHSMGGHGALVIALRNPGAYRSVSAFAPIAAPMQCPWGEKAFGRYLGADREQWAEYDASVLVARGARPDTILIDQGTDDKFLTEQLKPELFVAAARRSGQQVSLRMQPGYDHGYYFISTFMEDHLRFHAAALTR
jgi:S-formylglutathione hydrolase